METRNWYPKWVYNKREDITRENMRQYDHQIEELFETRMAKEKELGRKLGGRVTIKVGDIIKEGE